MALRNVYVAGGNGIGYTYEVDSSVDYSLVPNNSFFKDLSLGVGGMVLYKDSTGQILEIYGSNFGGAGNINTVAKFTSANFVGNSNITDNGTLIALLTDATINSLNIGRGAGNLNSNTVFGSNAFITNTTGIQNVAIGKSSLHDNDTGQENVSIGSETLYKNISGKYLTALGDSVLYNSLTGDHNVGLGYKAGYKLSSGSQNTLIGAKSILELITGSGNVTLGFEAGYYIAGGTVFTTLMETSVMIGAVSKPNADNQSNQIVIGYAAVGKGSNTATLGNNSITDTYLSGAVTINNAYKLPSVDGTAGYALITNGTGIVSWQVVGNVISSGTTTTNRITKWTNTTGSLGDSLISDNGTTLAIGASPNANIQFLITSNKTTGFSVTGTTTGVKGQATNGGSGVLGVSSGTANPNVGVEGQATGVSTENIGGKFTASSATVNYSLQLIDGTQTVGGGKFLRDTGDGKANWFNITLNDIAGAHTGTGTPNYVTKWTGTASQGDSIIFDNGTNVGIGTITPAAKFNIVHAPTIGGNNLANASILIGSTTAGLGLDINEIIGIGNPLYIGTASTNFLSLKTSNLERLLISATGEVGIGISTPTAKLHVNNTVTGLDSFLVEDDTNIDSTPFVINTSGNVGLGILTPTAKLHISNVVVQNAFLVEDEASDSTPFVITSVGNVGIGLLAPSTKLHIASATAGAFRLVDTTQGANKYLKSDANGLGTWSSLQASDVTGVVDGTGTANYVPKWVDTNTLTISAIHDNAGNIGIGTITASNKLQVSGSFKVDSAGSCSILANAPEAWYRLATSSVSNRGGIKLIYSTTGGTSTPVTYVIKAYKSSTTLSTLILEKYGTATFIKEVRIIEDEVTAGVYHIEGLLAATGVNSVGFLTYVEKTLGYENTWTVNLNQLVVSTSVATAVCQNSFTALSGGISLPSVQIKNNVLGNLWEFRDGSVNSQPGILNLIGSTANVMMSWDNTNTRVGIGTSAPAAKLDIVYAPSGADGVLIQGGGGTLDNIPLKLWDIGTAVNNKNIIEFGHSSTYVAVSRIYSTNPSPSATTGGRLILETASDNLGTFNANQLVLSNNGNVGIGILAPTRRFEVVTGSNTAYFDLASTNGPLAAVVTSDLTKLARFNASNGTVSISVGIRSSNETANPGFGAPNDAYIQANSSANGLNIFNTVGVGTSDYIRFYAGESANTSTAHLHIQGNGSTKGFIGIGTEAPTSKLDVNGDVKIDTILNATTDTDRFLVSDAGVVKYRTGAELLADIGGQGAITLTTTGSSGAATLISGTLNVPTYTLAGLGGEPTITAGTTAQYWRGDKTWQTLNTTAVAEGTNLYFTEGRVRSTPLTGLSVVGGSITSTDSVLSAFGKIQNQLNAVASPMIYQGTWNANTNTPALTSGTGTKGYVYRVTTSGSTNIDGVTDWKSGDFIVFNGTTWDKWDATDAVTSVNGYTGVVVISKADVGLSNVENTALSTWPGTTNITTLGTIGTGVWQGTAIADAYIASAATWNAKVGGTGTLNYLPLWSSTTTLATSGVYQDPITGNIGIGTSTPTTIFNIARSTTENFYVNLANTNGPLVESTTTDTTKRARLIASNVNSASVSIGQIGSTNTAGTAFGAPGDSYLASSVTAQNLNILTQTANDGTTTDHIELFAGISGNVATATPSMVILGSNNAATTATLNVIPAKENVGIGTANPISKLHVVGSLKVDSSGAVTVPANSPGWYRLANFPILGGSRGGVQLTYSVTGGNLTPVTYVIKAYKTSSTGGTLILEKYGSVTYMQKVRLILDESTAGLYHIEALISDVGSALSFQTYVEKTLGYEGGINVNLGALSLSASTATSIRENSFIQFTGGISVPNFQIQNNVLGNRWEFRDGVSTGILNIIGSSANVIMSLDDDRSRVGIGITAPLAKLHIRSNNSDDVVFIEDDAANPDASPFVIDNLGNVGVGVPTPATFGRLVVQGNGANGLVLNTDSGTPLTNSTRLFFRLSDGNDISMFNVSGNLRFGFNGTANSTSGVQKFIMTADGRLGVNTTSPGTNVAITAYSSAITGDDEEVGRFGALSTSGTAIPAYLSIKNNSFVDDEFSSEIRGLQSTTSALSALNLTGLIANEQDSSGLDAITIFRSRRISGALIASRLLFDFQNFTTSLMSINADGNVGMGTTAAVSETNDYKLRIVSKIVDVNNTPLNGKALKITTASNSNQGFEFQINASSNFIRSTSVNTAVNSTAYKPLIFNSTTDSLDTAPFDAVSDKLSIGFNILGTRILTLDSATNNVGIGTTTPTAKLHINSATSGAFRLVDGTQVAGRVLTCDANGVATWAAAAGGGGSVTSVAALTISSTSAADITSTVANSTTTPVITLNIPTASASNRGALSAANWTDFNNKQNAITLTTTGTSGAATFSGGVLNIPNYAGGVTSAFGRTGAVTAQSGDYTTTQVTEGTNLYFTNARGIAATLTGYASTTGTITSTDSILTAIQKLNGNIGTKQETISLTTTGTGAATFVGNVLNIPTPAGSTLTLENILDNGNTTGFASPIILSDGNSIIQNPSNTARLTLYSTISGADLSVGNTTDYSEVQVRDDTLKLKTSLTSGANGTINLTNNKVYIQSQTDNVTGRTAYISAQSDQALNLSGTEHGIQMYASTAPNGLNSAGNYFEFGNTTVKIGNKAVTSSFAGVQYYEDYSTNYVTRSLIDKGYLDTRLSSFVGDSLQHEVKAGVALTKGQAVFVSSANGTNMIVSKASNVSEALSSKTMGLIVQDLANNDIGRVITEGLLTGTGLAPLDTSSAPNEGDPVWLGTDGNLIFGLGNKPAAPAHLVFIGIVTRKSATVGEIFVKPQNGFELSEIHDALIQNKADLDVLTYDGATGLWKNKPSISYGLNYALSLQNFLL